MDDSTDALQQPKGPCAGFSDVDDRGASAAAIDLDEADLGSVWIEAGGCGMVNPGVQGLEPGIGRLGMRVDLRLWRTSLFGAPPESDRLGVDGRPLFLKRLEPLQL